MGKLIRLKIIRKNGEVKGYIIRDIYDETIKQNKEKILYRLTDEEINKLERREITVEHLLLKHKPKLKNSSKKGKQIKNLLKFV